MYSEVYIMDNEKEHLFKLFLFVCSITFLIELILHIWSNIQVSKLDFNKSNIEAIQLAKKGVITSLTLLMGTWITTCVSIFIPQIKVWKLYIQLQDHPHHCMATIFFIAYTVIPVVNTFNSISNIFYFIKESEISLFEMIFSFL